MKIDIKEIIDGKKNGEKIWICDFRFSDYGHTKPLRHVKPTQVIIVGNSELPKNKTVYYSESHFLALNKKGEPMKSKIIKPFDNTGQRSYTGVALNAFLFPYFTETQLNKNYFQKTSKVFYTNICVLNLFSLFL